MLPTDGFTYKSGSWQTVSQDASVLHVISLSPNRLTQAHKIQWSQGSSSARGQAPMYKHSRVSASITFASVPLPRASHMPYSDSTSLWEGL